MQAENWTIGQRIASHRLRRGLTQEELAGLVGISLSLMKKIESGNRPVTRFSQLLLFAQALRIRDLHDLTGVPLPLLPDGQRKHPDVDAVRAALVLRRASTAPPHLEQLAREVESAWATWQTASAFRYASAGQRLPGLIRQAHAAIGIESGQGRRTALREASKLYQLVRTWTKRVGEHELSILAADRAVSCALEADDPDLAAAAAWNLAMILGAQGHVDEADGVVAHAIEEIRPFMGDATDARLAVWGGLHLLGAAVAARRDRENDAWRLIDVADQVAGRTGETNHFRMVFGPTNVAIHRMSTAVQLGRTSDALRLAERVGIHGCPAVERRLTYCLDAARCHVRRRNDIGAVHLIQRIHRESPEELQYSVLVRETLRELMGRAPRAIEPELRPLIEAAGLRN
jgi:transcriptional regulator with XRE-family HTH domain